MTRLFVLSAPSGSGKTTLRDMLLEKDPSFVFSVSYTTRDRKNGERPGVDYQFVTRDEFLQLADNGEFLEHKQVFNNWYGTPKRYLEKAAAEDRDCLLDIDVQGAAELRKTHPNLATIFLLPPSRAILEQRLRARGRESEEKILERIAGALAEIRQYQLYDHVIVNDDREKAFSALWAVVKNVRLADACPEPERAIAEGVRSANPAVQAKVDRILATFAAGNAIKEEAARS